MENLGLEHFIPQYDRTNICVTKKVVKKEILLSCDVEDNHVHITESISVSASFNRDGDG